MKSLTLLFVVFICQFSAANPNGTLDAGVASVDITPTEPVVLAGSPSQLVSNSINISFMRVHWSCRTFACHTANARDLSVYADFPGAVQQHLRDHLTVHVSPAFGTSL